MTGTERCQAALPSIITNKTRRSLSRVPKAQQSHL